MTTCSVRGYGHTIRACFLGYVVQAVVNNFVPLLFVTFGVQYGIPLSKITLLITVNFLVQLAVDLASAFFVDRIGYRASLIAAFGFVAAGFVLLTFMPDVLSDPFAGLLVAVAVYAVGGGLLEVLISPVVEACPTDNKPQVMSMLHSFYCWGSVGVIALSTLFFSLFGVENWKFLALVWLVLPLVNGLIFTKVPIAPVVSEGEKGLPLGRLLKNKLFWLFMLTMFCAGACEQSVSQWASAFAEQGLGVAKAVGDLAGPALFAVMMGIARTVYGKFGKRVPLNAAMLFCGGLCAGSYLLISLTNSPVVALGGMAVCGFSVGVMWPGTFSGGAASVKGGGTAMFALFALAGDLGCSLGPTFVGAVASGAGGVLQYGILAALIFPVLLIAAVVAVGAVMRKNTKGGDETAETESGEE